MLIMMVVASYAYQHDVKICKEYVKNFDYYCMQRGNGGMSGPPNYSRDLNLGLGVIINNSMELNQSNITSDK